MSLTGSAVSPRVDRVAAALRDFMEIVTEVESARAHAGSLCDFAAGTPQEIVSREYVDALKRSAEPLSADWYGYKFAHRPAQEAAAAGLRSGRCTGSASRRRWRSPCT